jgi:hypothetical protein
MEKFIIFIDILAWVIAVLSTLFVFARIAAYCFYDELDRLRDKINGVQVHFPIINGSIVAIICWAWIIASYLAEKGLL